MCLICQGRERGHINPSIGKVQELAKDDTEARLGQKQKGHRIGGETWA